MFARIIILFALWIACADTSQGRGVVVAGTGARVGNFRGGFHNYNSSYFRGRSFYGYGASYYAPTGAAAFAPSYDCAPLVAAVGYVAPVQSFTTVQYLAPAIQYVPVQTYAPGCYTGAAFGVGLGVGHHR